METSTIILYSLAVWRLASIVAREGGPGDIFRWFRLRVGVLVDEAQNEVPTNSFTTGLTCVWCNSVWVGLLWAGLHQFFPGQLLIASTVLALSAASVFLDETLTRIQR